MKLFVPFFVGAIFLVILAVLLRQNVPPLKQQESATTAIPVLLTPHNNSSRKDQTTTAPTPQTPPYQEASADLGDFNITVGSTVWPLITDSAGRRTGKSSASSAVLQEIPESAFFEDSISDAGDGADTTATGVSRQIQISQPASGRYHLSLTTVRGGRYTLSIQAYSRDGSPQAPIAQTGVMAAGSQIAFVLTFTPNPGAVSTLSPAP